MCFRLCRFLFYIALFCNISNILCSEFSLGPENLFFVQARNIVDQVQIIKENNEFNSSKNVSNEKFLKELRFILSKLSLYNFKCDRISSSKLDELFKEIDQCNKKILDNNEICFEKEAADKICLIFDLLRKGIAYQLCFDELLGFREKLILCIDKLILMSDFWEFQANDNSLSGKISGLVEKIDKDEIRVKIRKLNFLKDRGAAYLGKTEEIFFKFFKNINLFYSADQKDLEKICTQLDEFIKEATFCMDCFFFQDFDPDRAPYSDKYQQFSQQNVTDVVRVVCKNNINVLLLFDGFDFQVQDCQIPHFLRRHWMAISLCGLAAVGSGIYVYNHFDDLMGDDPKSLKMRASKSWEEFYKWFTDSVETFKQDFGVESAKDKAEKAAMEAKEIELDGIVKKLEQQKKLINEVAAKKFVCEAGVEDGSKLDEEIKAAWEKINQTNKILDEIEAKFKGVEGRYFVGKATEGIGGFIDFVKMWFLPQIKDFFKEGEGGFANKGGVKLMRSISPILDAIHTILKFLVDKKVITKIDNMERTSRVTLNWTKAMIPITIVGIGLPIATFFTVKSILKSQKQAKYDQINLVISNIYRVLTYYKMQSFDYYQNEMLYKDQGMIFYWADKLNEYSENITDKNHQNLVRLVKDFQNPSLSISQKLELIRLEWGKNLFGEMNA